MNWIENKFLSTHKFLSFSSLWFLMLNPLLTIQTFRNSMNSMKDGRMRKKRERGMKRLNKERGKEMRSATLFSRQIIPIHSPVELSFPELSLSQTCTFSFSPFQNILLYFCYLMLVISPSIFRSPFHSSRKNLPVGWPLSGIVSF